MTRPSYNRGLAFLKKMEERAKEMSKVTPLDSTRSAPGPKVRSTSEGERTVISLFLATFFVVVGAWLIPDKAAPDKWWVTQYTWPVMCSTGWVQCWSLFSPDVREVNVHCNALIRFQDGTVKIYEFPRAQKMDLLTKFKREKLRKLFIDNMAWPQGEAFWPSIARYLARANYDPSNPPDTVTLIVNSHAMPPPDPKHWSYRDQLPEHTEKNILITYKVKPQDFLMDIPKLGQ